VELRWFYDLPLAVAYLVPKRLLGLSLDPNITVLSSTSLGATAGVPVDLVSFGYYSAGLVGAMVVVFGFGCILAIFEVLARRSQDRLGATLRAAWLMFLPFRLVYGDPVLYIIPGFWLIVTTGLVVLPGIADSLARSMAVTQHGPVGLDR
jgi:hypothetical protein